LVHIMIYAVLRNKHILRHFSYLIIEDSIMR